MGKPAKRGGDRGGRKPFLPPEVKRQQKSMLLAPETIQLLDRERAETHKGYGALIDHAVAVVYGDPFAADPECAPPPEKPRKQASLPPNEYDEYRQMRSLYDLTQIRKSARGKELADLYESRYQSERRGV